MLCSYKLTCEHNNKKHLHVFNILFCVKALVTGYFSLTLLVYNIVLLPKTNLLREHLVLWEYIFRPGIFKNMVYGFDF